MLAQSLTHECCFKLDVISVFCFKNKGMEKMSHFFAQDRRCDVFDV